MIKNNKKIDKENKQLFSDILKSEETKEKHSETQRDLGNYFQELHEKLEVVNDKREGSVNFNTQTHESIIQVGYPETSTSFEDDMTSQQVGYPEISPFLEDDMKAREDGYPETFTFLGDDMKGREDGYPETSSFFEDVMKAQKDGNPETFISLGDDMKSQEVGHPETFISLGDDMKSQLDIPSHGTLINELQKDSRNLHDKIHNREGVNTTSREIKHHTPPIENSCKSKNEFKGKLNPPTSLEESKINKILDSKPGGFLNAYKVEEGKNCQALYKINIQRKPKIVQEAKCCSFPIKKDLKIENEFYDELNPFTSSKESKINKTAQETKDCFPFTCEEIEENIENHQDLIEINTREEPKIIWETKSCSPSVGNDLKPEDEFKSQLNPYVLLKESKMIPESKNGSLVENDFKMKNKFEDELNPFALLKELKIDIIIRKTKKDSSPTKNDLKIENELKGELNPSTLLNESKIIRKIKNDAQGISNMCKTEISDAQENYSRRYEVKSNLLDKEVRNIIMEMKDSTCNIDTQKGEIILHNKIYDINHMEGNKNYLAYYENIDGYQNKKQGKLDCPVFLKIPNENENVVFKIWVDYDPHVKIKRDQDKGLGNSYVINTKEIQDFCINHDNKGHKRQIQKTNFAVNKLNCEIEVHVNEINLRSKNAYNESHIQGDKKHLTSYENIIGNRAKIIQEKLSFRIFLRIFNKSENAILKTWDAYDPHVKLKGAKDLLGNV